MTRALLLAEVGRLNLKAWWRDAVVDRIAWLIEDLWTGRSKTAWNQPTNEWLAKPRRKIGSSR